MMDIFAKMEAVASTGSEHTLVTVLLGTKDVIVRRMWTIALAIYAKTEAVASME